MDDFKIVTIGSIGHIGSVLQELGNSPIERCRVIGMASAAPEDSPEDLKQRFDICQEADIFENYEQMIEDIQPDLAIISTRIDQIGIVALRAAETGAHCICEKPLAIDRTHLERLYKVFREKDIACIAMLNNMVNPVLSEMKNVISAGHIGIPVICNARKSYKFGSRPDWYGKRELYGGTIPWVGIHGLDFIQVTTGLHFTRVAAMHSNMAHPNHPDCEDNCSLSLQLSNGGHATLSIDYLRPEAADTHGDDWLRVAGTKGVLEARPARQCYSIITEKGMQDVCVDRDQTSFYNPIINKMYSGKRNGALTELTNRSFMLTDSALAARDSADDEVVLSIGNRPWL